MTRFAGGINAAGGMDAARGRHTMVTLKVYGFFPPILSGGNFLPVSYVGVTIIVE